MFLDSKENHMRTAFCFDLDGTVTTEEILPVIARFVDLVDEIEILTKATINGLLPFEKSFRLRCQLLKDVEISKIHHVLRTVGLDPLIVDFLRTNKDNCFVITGNLNCWVGPLLDSLGCKYFASEGLVKDNSLHSVKDVLDKSEVVGGLRKKFDRIVSVGDGMGDVGMFSQSDVAVAFGGIHSPVRTLVESATHVIYSSETLCRFLEQL